MRRASSSVTYLGDQVRYELSMSGVSLVAKMPNDARYAMPVVGEYGPGVLARGGLPRFRFRPPIVIR